jgi:hypothetical protein
MNLWLQTSVEILFNIHWLGMYRIASFLLIRSNRNMQLMDKGCGLSSIGDVFFFLPYFLIFKK